MIPPTINTSNYVIQPYRLKDEERFVEMGIDTEVMRFMGGADGDPIKQRSIFHKIFKHYEEPNTNETKLFWGIHRDDLLCGHIQLKPTEYTSENELEIVYMVHPAERNKGIMKEVLLHFKSIQSRWSKRIIATVDFDNEISLNLLEHWGIQSKKVLTDPDDGEQFWKLTLSL